MILFQTIESDNLVSMFTQLKSKAPSVALERITLRALDLRGLTNLIIFN